MNNACIKRMHTFPLRRRERVCCDLRDKEISLHVRDSEEEEEEEDVEEPPKVNLCVFETYELTEMG